MEINLFYDRLEVCAIPPTAISLWFALMHIANKSGWPQEISIPVSTLEARAHLERRGVYRAREVLRAEGLIDFRERPGNQCAVYRIISLEGLLYNSDTQSVTQPPLCCTDLTHNPSHKAGLLYENDTQCVTQPLPESDSCCTDLTRKVSHKEGVLCNSDTQSVTQTEICCTNLTPLDKQDISIKIDKDKRGYGGKKKSSKSPANKKSDFDLSFVGDPVWEELLRTWLEYKRGRNQSYKSELSVKKFLTMLRNLSGGDAGVAQKIIDKSIANNWAGIFELTGDGHSRGQPPDRPASGQRIGQIKQPEDEARRQKLLDKFGSQSKDK